MKNLMKIVATTLVLFLLVSCGSSSDGDRHVVIGGKNFTEQYIMAEMLSQLIEEHSDISTSQTTNLGGNVIVEAIKADEIDLYLEYTGTALINLGHEPMFDPQEVYDVVKEEWDEQFDIKWLEPIGFNNTYAMMVTRETAEEYGLETISDLAEVGHELHLGGSYVFTERDDGYPGLKEHYDFDFAEVSGLDPALMYQALDSGSVDVISGFATEGRVVSLDLVLLEDDQQFFPPYDAAVIVRGEILEAYPELTDIINMLAGKIDDLKMAELNAKVDLDEMEPEDVVREFLTEEGLLNN